MIDQKNHKICKLIPSRQQGQFRALTPFIISAVSLFLLSSLLFPLPALQALENPPMVEVPYIRGYYEDELINQSRECKPANVGCRWVTYYIYNLYINHEKDLDISPATWWNASTTSWKGHNCTSDYCAQGLGVSGTSGRTFVFSYYFWIFDSEPGNLEITYNSVHDLFATGTTFLWDRIDSPSYPPAQGVRSGYLRFRSPPPYSLKPLVVSLDKMSMTKDPINIATGEMIIQATDISIKGRGPALHVGRTYRSQSGINGLFGHGWRSVYDINLTEDADSNVTVFNEKGVAIYFYKWSENSYLASLGNHSSLTKNSDGTFILINKHGIKTQFGTDGRLTAVTDRNGNTLILAFDPANPNGTYLEDAGGRRITLLLDANQRVASATDPAGRAFTYDYDVNGNLVMITDSNGKIVNYIYDTNHNIIQMSNPNGHHTYFVYDAQDRAVMNWQDGDVNKVTLNFMDPTTTVVTDSLSNTTTYIFNDYGLEISSTDTLGITHAAIWDDQLNRTASTDGNGITTSFSYDQRGNLIRIDDALDSVTTLIYGDIFNLVKTTSDVLNQTTTYDYDSRGNLTSLTDPLGNATTNVFDSVGNLIITMDALNNTTTYGYDLYGQQISVTDALSNATTNTYDAAGNLTTIVSPNGGVKKLIYDNLNRVIEEQFPDGTTILHNYDAFGNEIFTIDQKGNTTTSVYDNYERLSKIIDVNGGITSYFYDSEGRLTSLTDPKGQFTSFVYDVLGRKTSEMTANGQVTAYTYDSEGNILTRTDPNGSTTTYTYDELNRLIRTDYSDGASVARVYDQLGRLSSMTDGIGTTVHAYDAIGRLLTEDGPETSDTLTYTFDAAGNRLSLTDPEGNVTNYSYDALYRLSAVSTMVGETTYSYDVSSNIINVTYPSGAKIVTSYDVMNRPIDIFHKKGNKAFSSYSYSYDPAGMVSQMILKGGNTVDYLYDARNQLLAEIRTTSSEGGGRKGGGKGGKRGKDGGSTVAGGYENQFTYDIAGNRTSWVKTISLGDFWMNESANMPQQSLDDLIAAGYGIDDGSDQNRLVYMVKTYAYDADNRLLNWTHDLDAGGTFIMVEGYEYSYDDNGNRISQQQTRAGEAPRIKYYNYDFENRLVSVEYIDQPDIPVTNSVFEYNGHGNRVRSIEGSNITRYRYDGNNVLYETDEVGLRLRSYTRGLGFSGGIGGLISQTTKFEEVVGKGKNRTTIWVDKEVFFHYDSRGSVTQITDDTGSVITSFDYDAYGNKLSESNSINNTVQFSSKEWEEYVSLIYFGARYYDPLIGRWLTPDPAGFVDGLNLYLYVNNNPVNLIDLYGLSGERRGKTWGQLFWENYWQEQNSYLQDYYLTAQNWHLDLSYTGKLPFGQNLKAGATFGLKIGFEGLYGYASPGIGKGKGIGFSYVNSRPTEGGTMNVWFKKNVLGPIGITGRIGTNLKNELSTALGIGFVFNDKGYSVSVGPRYIKKLIGWPNR